MSDEIRTNTAGDQSKGSAERLSCHVVRDLLPLYIDGLTSEETSRDIKAHLDGCIDCSREYRAMTGSDAEQAVSDKEGEPSKEIDYLKKVRRRSRIPAVIAVCVAVLIVGFVILRVFVVGSEDNYTVSSVGRVSGKDVYLELETVENRSISTVDFREENGVVTVSVRTAPKFLSNNTFRPASYTAKEDVKTLKMSNGMVLWSDNIKVEEYTQHVFSARTHFIGNASEVGRLITNAQISNRTGLPFTMELKTASEPYGLKLVSSDKCAYNDVDTAVQILRLKQYACVLISCVDNLGYVEYEFKAEDGSTLIYRFSEADANEYLGKDFETYEVSSIKDFGKSAGKLQHLMNILGL